MAMLSAAHTDVAGRMMFPAPEQNVRRFDNERSLHMCALQVWDNFTGSLLLRCMYGTLRLTRLYSMLLFPDVHARYLDHYQRRVSLINAIIACLNTSL
jgi:hypothetical protein